MDRNCDAFIRSNNTYDILIARESLEISDDRAECIQNIGEKFVAEYFDRDEVPQLSIKTYGYSIIPKCFGLLDTLALETTGILQLQNQPALSLRGQGIFIGFVDTGITYEHPAFQNEDGTTRIVGIWDQTAEDGTPPNGMVYGAFYGEEQINEALRSERPREIVPEQDENGHGTFLAGVACGSTDGTADFSGAAPLAQIAVVKCKQAKPYLRDYYFIPQGQECYQENDLMMGISWLNRFAYERRMPLVLCIGMGSGLGNHVGDEPLAIQCDEFGRRRQRAVVVAAGNAANQRRHYQKRGMEEGAVESIELSVGSNLAGFQMEIWTMVPEIYELSIVSPTGERFPKTVVRPGERQEYVFLFEINRDI